MRAIILMANFESWSLVVETKGGNHKILKAWKEKHGADVVEGWVK